MRGNERRRKYSFLFVLIFESGKREGERLRERSKVRLWAPPAYAARTPMHELACPLLLVVAAVESVEAVECGSGSGSAHVGGVDTL